MSKPLPVTQPSKLMEFLQASFPDLTRTEVKRFLKFDAVRVNGRSVTQFDWKLKAGDDVRVLSAGESKGLGGLGNVRIVFEDAWILVVDKPPGLLTVATEKEREKTLYYRLGHYLREKSRGRERVFIVHRLDREVSGLLIFAKSEEAKLTLQKNWGRFEKRYAAVVEGAPAQTSGTVRSFLTEDALGNVTSSDAPGRNAREAVTRYRVMGSGNGYALLDVQLETGRKHQIRIHLADLGCPIAGDERYGAQSDPLGRLALHAIRIGFAHPESREPMEFETPLPSGFEAALRQHTTPRTAPPRPPSGRRPRPR
jgi:23S rRNA pseudouridine1911/1915/1917 synthase